MRIAYLVLAHDAPNHLSRLADALSSDSSKIFIHIDKKSDINLFCGIIRKNINLIKDRVPVYWGEYSQVEAILTLIREALCDEVVFDRFVLISGSDYPLRSAAEIENLFEQNKGKEFISLASMPAEWAGKPIWRLTKYAIRSDISYSIKLTKSIMIKLGLTSEDRDYKKYLRDINPYGGSTWWALTREACEHIIEFTNNEKEIVKFFKNTYFPDESFFHTIIGNSIFRYNVVRNLTYDDWSGKRSSPAYITDQHIDFLSSTRTFPADEVFGAGPILFARKFRDDSKDLVARIRAGYEGSK